MKFQPSEVKVFTGGSFQLDTHPKTIGELLAELDAVRAELAAWGEATKVQEVFVHNGQIHVTLAEGIWP